MQCTRSKTYNNQSTFLPRVNMTARVQRSFELLACVQFESEFFVNYYDFDITFNVESLAIMEQNIALERVKYYLECCVQNSIFIQNSNTESIEKFTNAGLRVCTLPEEPYDQVIGIMLLHKFNAIAEGRLVATDVSITSRLSDGVVCFYSIEENSGPFQQKGWWNDSNTSINDIKQKNKKVVKLSKTNFEWADLELAWEPKVKTESSPAVVLFDKTDK